MKSKRVILSGLVLVFACAGSVMAQAGANWPQWRGPNRDGVSKETGLLKQWPEDGPPLLWKASGAGRGYSSFSIANGRLYTMGLRGDREYVIAFDVATGKEAWATAHGSAFRNDRGDGPRGTPTVDGDRIYALGAIGAVCIIYAFRSGGVPTYVMPLVFAGAPLVNVLYSMWLHPPKTSPNPLLYLGFVLAALGGGLVLYFKPSS
jgi:hypothetical protein